MKIFTTEDRISVKIGELVFKLAPLTFRQKMEVQTFLTEKKTVEGIMLCVRYALKDASGLEKQDGSKYELKFDDKGILSEQSLDDILNADQGQKLQIVCAQLINAIPSQLDGIEGVEILHPQTGTNQKPKKSSH